MNNFQSQIWDYADAEGNLKKNNNNNLIPVLFHLEVTYEALVQNVRRSGFSFFI